MTAPSPWAESNAAAKRARTAAERLADALDRNLAGQPHAPLEPLRTAYEAADGEAERLRAVAAAEHEESPAWAAVWASASAARDALAALPDGAEDAERVALEAAAADEGLAAGLPPRSTGTRGALTRAAAFARQAAARAHARVGRSLPPEVVLSPTPAPGVPAARVEPGPDVPPYYMTLEPVIEWAAVAGRLEAIGEAPLTAGTLAAAIRAGLRGAS